MARPERAELFWEDDRFLAFDKPAGLSVIAPEGSRERTLYDQATDAIRRRNPRGRAAVVHRIDKGTSGIVIFAKDAEAKKTAMENWDDIVLERRYALVSEGRMSAGSGRFEHYLIASGTGKGQSRVKIAHRGEKRALLAVTEWEVVENGRRSQLVDALLLTGRKHQIRAQFSAEGHPLAGDGMYGARTDPLGRICLHAGVLVFRHPFTHEEIRLESPTPGEFYKALG
jgi:23S rRNA pseudouridine1911/1915/1917 synthase